MSLVNARYRCFFLGAFCISLCFSCSKKPDIFTKEQMLKKVPFEGPDKIEVVLAKDINDAVPCSDYGEGCLGAHRFRARTLDFIAVEFGLTEQAEFSAKKIHAWTVKNWLFDDVYGEPLLEKWIEKHFGGEPLKKWSPPKK